jgi:hypothetical protein
MALQAQQLVALATQIAGAPGFSAQAGQLLNSILSELCQDYDFDLARGATVISLSLGSGPYQLPADYLRADYGDVFFTLFGVAYPLTAISLQEYDLLVQPPATSASYPSMYATDLSLTDNVFPALFVWPPSSGSYPLTVRYRRQMPDITTPETSAVVPWFPNSNYLMTRLSGELMKIIDDTRADDFLGDKPNGAQGILNRYLKLKDDKSNRAEFVKLDRRRFGSSWPQVPNTKLVGW